jgi:hypothetical protein
MSPCVTLLPFLETRLEKQLLKKFLWRTAVRKAAETFERKVGGFQKECVLFAVLGKLNSSTSMARMEKQVCGIPKAANNKKNIIPYVLCFMLNFLVCLYAYLA